MGLLSVPATVRTSTILVLPSGPGCIVIISPLGQTPLGKFESTINTMSPGFRFSGWFSVFGLGDSVGKYSFSQRFQNVSVRYCTVLHVGVPIKVFSSKSPMRGQPFDRPIKKWLGVKLSSSFGSRLGGVSGRELTRCSASNNSVCNTSSRGCLSFRVAYSAVFTVRTNRSHVPPI